MRNQLLQLSRADVVCPLPLEPLQRLETGFALAERCVKGKTPGSIRFTFRGRTYVDRNGSLYYDINPATNVGTLGGSYDYVGNIATITEFGSGSSTTVTIHSQSA